MTNQSLTSEAKSGSVFWQDGASQTSKAKSDNFWEVMRSLPQDTENNLVHSLFSLQQPKQEEICQVYRKEDRLVRAIVKVDMAFKGKPRNQLLMAAWESMNRCLVKYMAANHRLLRKLDFSMGEDVDQDHALIQLVLQDYGRYNDAHPYICST